MKEVGSEPGWVQLFNGKDLTGWDAGETPGAWKVDDGAIVGTGKSASLATKKAYAEFHLRADIMLNPGEAAIAFRRPAEEVRTHRKQGSTSVSYTRPLPFWETKHDDANTGVPGWTRIEITAEAGHFEVKVGGKTVIGPEKLLLPLRPDRAGPIVLRTSASGGTMRFRNVEIKEPPPTFKDDKERLQGRWVAESVEMDGQPRPQEIVKRMSLTFSGNRVKTVPVVAETPYRRELRSISMNKANPKKIDIIDENRKGTFGIYRFDDDRFVLCGGDDDEKDRPTEFSSKGGKNRMVAVFKRATAEDSGWVQLFNGKDLTGWSAGANADAWKVVGSELVGAGKGTVLRTDRKTSTDFHLRAELKLRRGDQAAIGFHNTSEEVRIGIDGDYATVDYIAPNGVGFMHQGINPKEILQEEVKPIRVEIIAKLDHIEVKLNDRTIIKGRLLLPGGAPDRSGPILLKAPDSGRGVRFRKIEIKEFPPTPADPLPEPKLVKRPERQMELKAIGLAYTSCLEYRKKPPASAADLKDLLKADPKAWTALNDGSVVFFYNVGVLKMIEGASRTVLAYETRTPDSGGYVLMADGFVRLVTADAFKKMHLAGPRPEPGWVPLFNGKDLSGWKTLPGKKADWKVETGELVGRSSPESLLFSESVGTYQGFLHLKADVKLNAEGIAICDFLRVDPTKFDDAPGDAIAGYEADLDFTPGTPSSPIGKVSLRGRRPKRMQQGRASRARPCPINGSAWR